MAQPPSPEQRIAAPVLTALSGTTPDRGESRLRTMLRHSLPVVGVVVVVVLVAVIAYFVYDSNRRGAVMLSNDLITAIQDAYVEKVIDTLNDLPNVLWAISEEAPANSVWWHQHQVALSRKADLLATLAMLSENDGAEFTKTVENPLDSSNEDLMVLADARGKRRSTR